MLSVSAGPRQSLETPSPRKQPLMDKHETLVAQIADAVHICENGPWMIPDDVPVPDGAEAGEALVIGVGGSTLRLTHVVVQPRGHSPGSSYSNLMVAEIEPEARTGGRLFAWCAAQLAPFLEAHHTGSEAVAPVIALSWSFPLINGKIQALGKTFGNQYVGCDLLEEFNRALPPQFQVQQVAHDGLSSLIAGMHASPNCRLALTLGTGLNVTLVGPDGRLVNTEISMLGRPDLTPTIALPREPWDIDGPAADFQPFETRIGGMWLGPMASRALGTPITTLELWRILETPGHPHYKTVDCIVTRAAALVASSLYGLTLAFTPSTHRQEVAYTGGVIFEPLFRARVEAAMAKCAARCGMELALVPQRQGSEVGAAIAALCRRQRD